MAKSYKTSWTLGGTTRAAESLAIPVNAYQKNLLTQNQATGGDTLGDTTGFVANVSTITRDTSNSWNGTGSIKVVTSNVATNEGVLITASSNVTVGKIFTGSMMLKGSGTVIIQFAGYGGILAQSAIITLTSTWTRYQITGVSDALASYLRVLTNTQQAATFYIDGLQLEEGTTASDWALPEVDYSNAVLNPSAGTIEMDVDLSLLLRDAPARFLFGAFDTWGSANGLGIYSSGNALQGVIGTQVIAATIIGITGIKRVSVRYSPTGAAIYVDGVLKDARTFVGTLTDIGSALYIGRGPNTYTTPINTFFSNLRISKIARSDAEMAYTGKLRADSYTTFFRKYWR